MKIIRDIVINFTQEDVKEIIADYVKRQGYKVTTDDVTLSVGSKTVGYGMQEYEKTYFTGACVHCKEE